MSKVLPLSKPALPEGIGDTPLDAALLVARMRELYRNLRFKAETSSNDQERELCHRLMREVEVVIEEHGKQRLAWEAARADLVHEILKALREHEA